MPDEDKQIEIKKRARRRLVGAAALALLAAIVLPMGMDSEPRPPGHDIQIRIPPQSGDNSVAKDIAAERPTVAPVIAPAPVESTPEPVAAAVAPRPEAPPTKPTADKPAPPDPGAAVPNKAAADERRPAAILAGELPSAPGSGQFVVQLGAYRDKANAVSLQNKLRSEGFSSYTEKAGDKTRVRVGPFGDRAAADAAAGRLKSLGLGGAVVPRD